MMKDICGIVIKVESEKFGKIWSKEILGKTMLEWVALSLGEGYSGSVMYEDGISVPILVRDKVVPSCKYTVVLYSDTPLITTKTILDAVATLEQKRINALRMTRGYVFKTEYLLEVEKLYLDKPYFFEEEDFISCYDYKQMALVQDILRSRILAFHMEHGVRIVDTSSAYIDCDVVIGEGSEIEPNVFIKGKSVLGKNVKVLSGSRIEESIIDDDTSVNSSQIYRSIIGKNVKVGPFAYLRPETVVGDDCRVGDFVELKKCSLGSGSKVAHLSYLGDCSVGENCNIGCGVVFCNYDGKSKYHTSVGDNVFVGSNCNLIAPLVIEDNAFLAAGSTLTCDVPNSALAIARARQVIKPDWNKKELTKEP